MKVLDSQSRRQFLTRTGAIAGLGLAGLSPLARAAFGGSDIRVQEIKTFLMDDAFYVKVTSDSGVSGWGETDAGRPALFEAMVHTMLARHVVGQDPFDTGPITDRMFYGNHDFGPGGALANGIAGIDIALWDLIGKVLEVPVYELLGGQYRSRMPVYGSYGTGRWERMTPQEAADQAEKFVGIGLRTVKCRMQIRESHLNPVQDRTIEYVDTIKQRIGDAAELFVDINNGYSAKNAIQIGRVLQDEYGLRFYEEPCSDQNHADTAAVVAALDLAVIAGEKEYTPWQLAELIQYANPDYLNPDVIKAMGITGMHKIGVLSQVSQKPMIPHNTRPVLSTAASLQIAASRPIIGPFMEYVDVDRFPGQMGCIREGYTYEDGHLLIPSTPGIGIELDEEKIEARSSSVKVFTAE